MSAKGQDLLTVQYLRALAALMVVAFHGFATAERYGAPTLRTDWLASGVDIFFVISGCIMWITTANRETSPQEFWYRRIVRIVPLYWLFTAFIVALLLLVPQVFRTTVLDISHAISSFLFIPHKNPGTGIYEPLLIPGWTLNLEMFFYLIFGFTLLLKNRTHRLIAMVSALVVLTSVGLLMNPGSALGFYTTPLMAEFGFGVLLGEVFLRGWLRIPGGLPILLLGLGLIPALALAAPQAPHLLGVGLPAALIVAGALAIEARGKSVHATLPHLLGDASYSIYLSHTIFQAAMMAVWGRLWPPQTAMDAWAFTIASFVVCSVAGVITYWAFEQPLLKIFRPRRQRRAQVSSA